MIVRGRLERAPLAGGTWVIRVGGQAWTLYGDIPAKLEGSTVEVDGEEGGFGIGMAGPSLTVRRVKGC